jgi:hypothetical protein
VKLAANNRSAKARKRMCWMLLTQFVKQFFGTDMYISSRNMNRQQTLGC